MDVAYIPLLLAWNLTSLDESFTWKYPLPFDDPPAIKFVPWNVPEVMTFADKVPFLMLAQIILVPLVQL